MRHHDRDHVSRIIDGVTYTLIQALPNSNPSLTPSGSSLTATFHFIKVVAKPVPTRSGRITLRSSALLASRVNAMLVGGSNPSRQLPSSCRVRQQHFQFREDAESQFLLSLAHRSPGCHSPVSHSPVSHSPSFRTVHSTRRCRLVACSVAWMFQKCISGAPACSLRRVCANSRTVSQSR